MEDEIKEEIEKISKHDFYFETPLYDLIHLSNLEENILTGDVDAYSAANGFDTTYQIHGARIEDSSFEDFYDFYKIILTCKRKGNDKLMFFAYKSKEFIVKLGQIPSLADIQFADIGKKYDKFLSREDLKEFKRAIGLAANGVGVGSFVYLRRIFENLIYETFNENKDKIGIPELDFSKKRMEEKIDALKNYLPSQLIAMKSVYSILSKGIHELDENICLRYFSALKLSIELILEQKIEMEIKQKRDEEIKKQIQSISEEVTK
jgi:hypothetical protein